MKTQYDKIRKAFEKWAQDIGMTNEYVYPAFYEGNRQGQLILKKILKITKAWSCSNGDECRDDLAEIKTLIEKELGK
jgi:hypothetical protein